MAYMQEAVPSRWPPVISIVDHIDVPYLKDWEEKGPTIQKVGYQDEITWMYDPMNPWMSSIVQWSLMTFSHNIYILAMYLPSLHVPMEISAGSTYGGLSICKMLRSQAELLHTLAELFSVANLSSDSTVRDTWGFIWGFLKLSIPKSPGVSILKGSI